MSQTISPNTTLAQYRIVSKLGAGGMGEVYLAQDTKRSDPYCQLPLVKPRHDDPRVKDLLKRMNLPE